MTFSVGIEDAGLIDPAGCRELAAKLPTGKSESDKALRNKIFQQFDPNGNGFLSLAEVDKGVHDVLGLDVRAAFACGVCFDSWLMNLSGGSGMDQELFKCKPAIMRAFQAAKGVHKVIAGRGALSCFCVGGFI